MGAGRWRMRRPTRARSSPPSRIRLLSPLPCGNSRRAWSRTAARSRRRRSTSTRRARSAVRSRCRSRPCSCDLQTKELPSSILVTSVDSRRGSTIRQFAYPAGLCRLIAVVAALSSLRLPVMAQPNLTQEKRVLSIQSHVVAGYVGNKAASFPLQLLGWEVDAALTVSFSNHTASYGRWGGSKFDAAHLEDVFSALDANGLLRQSHLLTGYVPGADALKVVVRAVDRLRAVNPSLVYVLDPVMGDDGRIYVSESVIPIYKALLPRATCATPNYFEAELLTDVKILDAASLQLALRTFHERYSIPNIVISAVSLPVAELVKLGFVDPATLTASSATSRMLVCSGSTITSAPGEPLTTVSFGIAFPELAEHYEGVGDVFSSLVVGRFPSDSDPVFAAHPVSPLAHTVELAIASLQGILTKTRQHALTLAKSRPDLIVPREGESAEDRVRRLRTVELRLVQSQQEILNPDVQHRAVRF